MCYFLTSKPFVWVAVGEGPFGWHLSPRQAWESHGWVISSSDPLPSTSALVPRGHRFLRHAPNLHVVLAIWVGAAHLPEFSTWYLWRHQSCLFWVLGIVPLFLVCCSALSPSRLVNSLAFKAEVNSPHETRAGDRRVLAGHGLHTTYLQLWRGDCSPNHQCIEPQNVCHWPCMRPYQALLSVESQSTYLRRFKTSFFSTSYKDYQTRSLGRSQINSQIGGSKKRLGVERQN